MKAKNPEYRKLIETVFKKAAFVNDIGMTLLDCGPGWCESRILILPRHLQQDGVVHAGVQATIADHTAGAAATTMLDRDQFVLTAEFKINFLRMAVGESLICHAQVLNSGKMITVVESNVYAVSGAKKTLVSKTTATMSVLTSDK